MTDFGPTQCGNQSLHIIAGGQTSLTFDMPRMTLQEYLNQDHPEGWDMFAGYFNENEQAIANMGHVHVVH